MNDLLQRADGYIDTLEQGRNLISEIEAESQKTLIEMRMTDDNSAWQEMSNYRYDLLKAKRTVQTKMQMLVKRRG